MDQQMADVGLVDEPATEPEAIQPNGNDAPADAQSPTSSQSQQQQRQSSEKPATKQPKPKMTAAPPPAAEEEAKYISKYKDLRRKVKEVEAENDRIQFKVLQAKRNIQRIKLERAIMYERLANVQAEIEPVPPAPRASESPEVPLSRMPLSPPAVAPVGRGHTSSHEHSVPEYATSRSARIMDPDGRPLRVPSPNGLRLNNPPVSQTSSRSSRQEPAPDNGRLLPHLPPLPTMQGYERGLSHHSPSLRPSHTSPASHHSHASPSLRIPSQSPGHRRQPSGSSHDLRSRTHDPSSSGRPSMSFQDGHHPHTRHIQSPPSPDRPRARRPDIREITIPNDVPSGHLMSPRSSESHTSDVQRHPVQRIPPGAPAYTPRDALREPDRDSRNWDRDRDVRSSSWHERDREAYRHSPRSPQHALRSPRRPISPLRVSQARGARSFDNPDFVDYRGPPSRVRDEHGSYYSSPSISHDMSARSHSGPSALPDGPPRPDHRMYDIDRGERHYRSRTSSQTQQPREYDMDLVLEDGRSRSRDRGGSGLVFRYHDPQASDMPSRSPHVPRKRVRDEMSPSDESGPSSRSYRSDGRRSEPSRPDPSMGYRTRFDDPDRPPASDADLMET
ncbi:hypothetical protein FISHEDRAFT_72808 [Fistulina hepatica ATCC 64428]|nr:hypothetical protein FISHEDRAFT_72808 [Fistulina hepatica ATCC 64428]